MRCDFMDAVCSCRSVRSVMSLMNSPCSEMLIRTVVHVAELLMPQLRALLYIQRVRVCVGQGMSAMKHDEMPRALARGTRSGSH